jgi:hypothetical protein
MSRAKLLDQRHAFLHFADPIADHEGGADGRARGYHISQYES